MKKKEGKAGGKKRQGKAGGGSFKIQEDDASTLSSSTSSLSSSDGIFSPKRAPLQAMNANKGLEGLGDATDKEAAKQQQLEKEAATAAASSSQSSNNPFRSLGRSKV